MNLNQRITLRLLRRLSNRVAKSAARISRSRIGSRIESRIGSQFASRANAGDSPRLTAKTFPRSGVRAKSKSPYQARESELFGYLEVCFFAFLFIVIFSAVARADDDSAYGTSGNTQIFGTTLNSRVVRMRSPPQRVLDTAPPTEWSFFGAFTTETIRNLNLTEHASYAGSYMILTAAIYKPWDLSLSSEIGFSQQYSYAQENDGTSRAFDNPIIRLQKLYLNGRDFSSIWVDDIRLIVTGSLPANRVAGHQSFEGSVGPSINFDKRVGRFNLTQGIGYARGFYQYDMDAAGTINAPDVLKSLSLFSLSLADSLTWTNSLLYSYALDFQKVGKATEIFTSSVDCLWTSHFSTSLGLMTNRGTLDADGRTNRVLIFDQDGSLAFLDLGWKI